MTKRKLKCSEADFIYLFQQQSVTYDKIPNKEFKDQIKSMGVGSFVLYTEGGKVVKDFDCICCLNHPNSVTPMVSKEVVSSMKIRYLKLEDIIAQQ
mmetsp:Transcript_7292/g.6609  ORF Transcript_7292/g.6609 Transcript_7292/m.6609 type:complete len:96 (+) Transcript_7292:2089-2376(+)